MPSFVSFDFYPVTDDIADYDTNGNFVGDWNPYNFAIADGLSPPVASGDLLIIVAQFHVPSGATPVVEFGSGSSYPKPYTFTADTSWDSHVLDEFVIGEVWTKVWARRIGDTSVPTAGGLLQVNVTGLPLVTNTYGTVVDRPDGGHLYSTVLRDIADVSIVYQQAFGPGTPYTPPAFQRNAVHYLFGHTSDTAGPGPFEPRALPNGEEGNASQDGFGRAYRNDPHHSWAWFNNDETEWLGDAMWSTVGGSTAFDGWEWSQTATVTGVLLAVAPPAQNLMMIL